jgi:hypothetical protein
MSPQMVTWEARTYSLRKNVLMHQISQVPTLNTCNTNGFLTKYLRGNYFLPNFKQGNCEFEKID